MDLEKEIWTKKDFEEFEKYLATFSKGEEKGEWEKRIVNTSLPCIAVPSTKIDELAKKIYKGNFISFIDVCYFSNFSLTRIVGILISKIKDFDVQKKYLYDFCHKVDNWASIDCIKISSKKHDDEYLSFAKELLKDDYIFARRLGAIILLKIINEKTIDEILNTILSLTRESEYYVNMALSWLVAECFVKFRDKTLPLFESKKLNSFVQNKGISKCRDSFRVGEADKEYLFSLRMK